MFGNENFLCFRSRVQPLPQWGPEPGHQPWSDRATMSYKTQHPHNSRHTRWPCAARVGAAGKGRWRKLRFRFPGLGEFCKVTSNLGWRRLREWGLERSGSLHSSDQGRDQSPWPASRGEPQRTPGEAPPVLPPQGGLWTWPCWHQPAHFQALQPPHAPDSQVAAPGQGHEHTAAHTNRLCPVTSSPRAKKTGDKRKPRLL